MLLINPYLKPSNQTRDKDIKLADTALSPEKCKWVRSCPTLPESVQPKVYRFTR